MKKNNILTLVVGALVFSSSTGLLQGQDEVKPSLRPERPAVDPRPTTEPNPRPTPVGSAYSGGYVFAAVDLRGENRSAGVGFIKVADNSAFKGHVRNHESGAVARFSGKVVRGGKLEFIPGFENVRHNIRILRRRECIHGLGGRYLIRNHTADGDASDPGPSRPEGDSLVDRPAITDEPGDGLDDLSTVIRSAGVVIGFRR